MSEPIAGLGAFDFPEAGSVEIDIALRLLLGFQDGLADGEGIAVRIVGADRQRHGIDLDDPVAFAVNCHVETHVEDVLVIVCIDSRRNDSAVIRRFTWP